MLQDIHDKKQAWCHCHWIPPEDSQCTAIPWVMAWLQGELEEIFVGVSLSLLSGGIFPIDDIPVEFRSIVDPDHEIELRSGSGWERYFHISAVLNQSPTGPLYTLMLIMRHTWLRPEEDTDGYPTDDHSSGEDYSLSGDE